MRTFWDEVGVAKRKVEICAALRLGYSSEEKGRGKIGVRRNFGRLSDRKSAGAGDDSAFLFICLAPVGLASDDTIVEAPVGFSRVAALQHSFSLPLNH